MYNIYIFIQVYIYIFIYSMSMYDHFSDHPNSEASTLPSRQGTAGTMRCRDKATCQHATAETPRHLQVDIPIKCW